MKKILLTRTLLFISIFSLILTTPIVSQNCKISGIVIDTKTSSPLPGANALLLGTSLGAAANLDGKFLITSIPPGEYTLRIRYIGYSSKDIKIRLKSNQKLQIQVQLDYQTINLGEDVVVSAQRQGQVAAINQQLTSSSIVNVVSADKIKELPDANAAEAIGRLPGISLQRNSGEGQKIVIRGLEPKLNNITLNGIRIPSSDATDRSVDLSMISAETLAGIEVFKAPTPDMDAEAIGGTVNLVVKEAPQNLTGVIKVLGGYNQMHNDFGDFKILGQVSNRFFDDKFGVIASINYEKINRGSDRMSVRYEIGGTYDDKGNIPINAQKLDVINILETRKRFGGNLTLDFNLASIGSLSLINIYNSTSRNNFSRTKRYLPQDDEVNHFTQAKEFDLNILSNQLIGRHNFLGLNMDWNISRFSSKTNNPYDFQLQFRELSAFNQSYVDFTAHPSTFPNAAKNNLDNTMLSKAITNPDTTEQIDYTASINLELPITFNNDISGIIKFGGKYFNSNRMRRYHKRGEYFYYLAGRYSTAAQKSHPHNLLLLDNGGIAISNFLDNNYSLEDFLKGNYQLSPLLSEDRTREWLDYHTNEFSFDREGIVKDYDIFESIAAGYLMAKINIGQWLMILPGVRFEQSNNRYKGIYSTVSDQYGKYGVAKDSTTFQEYNELLPHLHVQIKPSDWYDIRLSFTKTIARPDFSFITPRYQINDERSTIISGNTNLKHTTSMNYDAYLSFYGNTISLFTVGAFYKDLNNIFYPKKTVLIDKETAIANGFPNKIGYELSWFDNSNNAKVWGFEFDLQTHLSFLPGVLQGIIVSANYSRMFSETYLPFYQLETIFNLETNQYEQHLTTLERKNNMPGQADHILNLSVGYDYADFSARISTMYQGESIFAVGMIPEQDRYSDSFWRVDASVKQKFFEQFSLFLNLMNLTGQHDRSFYGLNGYPLLEEYYGVTANLGIQYKL